MKTKTLIAILLITLSIFNTIKAQYLIKQKTINGETYIIEQRGETEYIKNGNGMFDLLGQERGKYCEYFHFTNQDELKKLRSEIIKSVFSEARIKELSEDKRSNILIVCLCNRNGEIKAVNFIKTATITLSEINAMEKIVLKMKTSIDCQLCPDTKYFLFNFSFIFSRL